MTEKLEFLAQKLTELGVARLVPVRMERSVAKAEGDKRGDRLRKISRDATMASKNTLIISIFHLTNNFFWTLFCTYSAFYTFSMINSCKKIFHLDCLVWTILLAYMTP